jgi:hypothetical protein
VGNVSPERLAFNQCDDHGKPWPCAECQEAAPVLTPQQHLEAVNRDATRLAETLVAANDAGVSHALILPQLVLVFRTAFGEMPAGFTIPGMPS